MRTWLKILLSSILSFLIFAAGCVAIVRYNGFELVELRFYEPRVIAGVQEKLDSVSSAFDEFYAQTVFSLSNFCAQESTKSFFMRSAGDELVKSRTDALGLLQEQIAGLGLRVIESDGRHVHFSTFKDDILKQEGSLTSYKPYDEISSVPFDAISASSAVRLTFSSEQGMLVFSLPLKSVSGDTSGTAVFFVPVEDFTELLVSRGIITRNQYGILVAPELYASSENSGIVFGFPSVGQALVAEQIVSVWSGSPDSVTQIVARETEGEDLTLITRKSSEHVLAGWVCSESDFVFSREERFLLLIGLFIVLYLLVFLLFNLKHESSAVIQKRIQKFGNAVLRQYRDKAWPEVSRELLGRRQDSFDEIQKSLGKIAAKHPDEVRFYFDRCWSELILTLGGSTAAVSAQPSAPQTAAVPPSATQSAARVPPAPVAAAAPADEVEELADEEELEEAEEIESAEEVEAVEVEAVEELDEVADADSAESAEELSDAEELEEIEEIESADDVEELTTEVEPEEVEELAEDADADGTQPVEELDDAEELEEVADADAAESAEEDDGLPDVSLLTEPRAQDDTLSLDDFLSDGDTFAEAPAHDSADAMFKEDLVFEDVKPRPQFLPSDEQKEYASSFSVAHMDFSTLDEAPAEEEVETVASPYQAKADFLVAHMTALSAPAVEPVSPAAPAKSRGGLLGHAMLIKKELETPQKAIVEQSDGVFVIPDGLSTRGVKQNPEFKKLVDSVLNR